VSVRLDIWDQARSRLAAKSRGLAAQYVELIAARAEMPTRQSGALFCGQCLTGGVLVFSVLHQTKRNWRFWYITILSVTSCFQPI
jgi:hypothetical protein